MDRSLPPLPGIADSLALAVVVASEAPLLLLDGEGVVVAASSSFSQAFGLEEGDIAGRPLSQLGAGEWDTGEVNSLVSATVLGMAKVGAYETDLVRSGRGDRRLLLRARKLNFGDPATVRVLLTVTDLTEARLADTLRDKLLHEKTALLKELQHRVADSLQIIASVLMQSARRVQSDEVRGHLYEAHSRVMSIRAIQRHLTAASVDDVEMRPYLTDLCRSIGTSLISGADRKLALTVDVDDSFAAADVSTCIGLVVTELVINALKHAFPEHQDGSIVVTFGSDAKAWTLCVADDGVGMGGGPAPHKAGLGTSIVTAIAARLSARVERADSRPGTRVSLIGADHSATPTLVPLPMPV